MPCLAVVCGDGDGKMRELVVWGVGLRGPYSHLRGNDKG